MSCSDIAVPAAGVCAACSSSRRLPGRPKHKAVSAGHTHNVQRARITMTRTRDQSSRNMLSNDFFPYFRLLWSFTPGTSDLPPYRYTFRKTLEAA